MHVPLSVEDELRHFLLAPSKRLDDTSFVQVLDAVFLHASGYTSGVPIAEVGDIQKIMFSNPETSSSATSIQESPGTSSSATSGLTTLITNTFAKRMLNLINKEACGIPLLGAFAAELADHLALAMSLEIKADMEFPVVKEKTRKPGTKPACDGAICAIVSCASKISPLILYEYNPTVDTRCDHVNHHDLMEALIQAFYCLHQYHVSTVLLCLTDMKQWYYFRADLVQAKLKITWYKAINEAMASVESHKEFLYPHLSLICGKRNYT